MLVKGDLLDEIDEGFLVNLTGPTNATLADGQGAGTITDDDATPTLSINDVTEPKATRAGQRHLHGQPERRQRPDGDRRLRQRRRLGHCARATTTRRAAR